MPILIHIYHDYYPEAARQGVKLPVHGGRVLMVGSDKAKTEDAQIASGEAWGAHAPPFRRLIFSGHMDVMFKHCLEIAVT